MANSDIPFGEIDLMGNHLPEGASVEIVGVGILRTGGSFAQCLVEVLCAFTGKMVVADANFCRRVTILEFVQKPHPFLKVRLAPEIPEHR